ncbi:hypothetical protein [Idiomarina abyssalis]|uniref:hypothetical protein n=1 Tax=Idiomarina abyssalis TaxID=86102 RepID=UPI003A90D57F
MSNKIKDDRRKKTALGHKRFRQTLSRKTLTKDRYRGLVKIDGEVYHKIEAPEVLSIYSNQNGEFEATLEFKERLVKSRSLKGKTLVSFKFTKSFDASALLLIYSAVEQATPQETENQAKVRLADEPKVNMLLKRSNLKRLIEGRELIRVRADDQLLPVISSDSAEYTEEIVDFIKRKIYNNDLTANDESILSEAVMEAVENVLVHAYPELQTSPEPLSSSDTIKGRQWWMVCDVVKDQLYLAIMDSGVGIPETVKHKNWFEKAFREEYPELYQELYSELGRGERLLEKLNYKPNVTDANFINISMTGDLSSIEQQGRGQGSKSIKSLVSENEMGKLWVFSGKGLYLFRSNDDKELYNLPKSIKGTLLQWNIRIK